MSLEKYIRKNDRKVLHVRIEKDLHEAITAKADKMNLSITRLTEALFRRLLDKPVKK